VQAFFLLILEGLFLTSLICSQLTAGQERSSRHRMCGCSESQHEVNMVHCSVARTKRGIPPVLQFTPNSVAQRDGLPAGRGWQ
jgi:hypothetical protein